ncbi:MAG: hypothetical protein AB7F59_03175 [Bdellovibrionales bacterium]
MKSIFSVLTLLAFSLTLSTASAEQEKKKKVKYRKTQEVSFDGDDVDGVRRNPYGAYLVQKRGVDFAPLYNVRQKFENNIKGSADYIR